MIISSVDEAIQKLGETALIRLINSHTRTQDEMRALAPRDYGVTLPTRKAEAVNRLMEMTNDKYKIAHMTAPELLDYLILTPEDNMIIYLLTCICEALDDKQPI